MRLYFYLIILCLFTFHQVALGQAVRYQNPVFNNVTVTTVKYGSATNYFGANQNLYMDIYQPAGDVVSSRPMVMMMFGGSFLVGRRQATDMVAWCTELAKHGYVCVSIDYRLGYTIGYQRSAVRAAYRAVQDARAAMRYLMKNKNTYKINANRVFIGGESAGSMAALAVAYMNLNSERPSETFSAPFYVPENTDLGCLDCSGNNLNNTFVIKGIINLWGAVLNLNQIESNQYIPAVSIHGTDDTTVPMTQGVPYSANYLFPTVYGSQPISQRLTNFGVYNEFYTYQGQGHVFYGTPDIDFPNNYWSPVFQQGKNFLYTRLQQLNAGGIREGDISGELSGEVNGFAIQSIAYQDNQLRLTFFAEQLSNTQLSVYDMNGRIIQQQFIDTNEGINSATLDMPLTSGIYILKLNSENAVINTKFWVQ